MQNKVKPKGGSNSKDSRSVILLLTFLRRAKVETFHCRLEVQAWEPLVKEVEIIINSAL